MQTQHFLLLLLQIKSVLQAKHRVAFNLKRSNNKYIITTKSARVHLVPIKNVCIKQDNRSFQLFHQQIIFTFVKREMEQERAATERR